MIFIKVISWVCCKMCVAGLRGIGREELARITDRIASHCGNMRSHSSGNYHRYSRYFLFTIQSARLPS